MYNPRDHRLEMTVTESKPIPRSKKKPTVASQNGGRIANLLLPSAFQMQTIQSIEAVHPICIRARVTLIGKFENCL
ncbi:hypothetical protein CEXT_750851 [Caerostris extrusa]|uniref:Uncharacterized protein n=1 Tax=Caerostris extrusa TaxID=172846 RepID=A0AAV4P285_CAEEX|nr:hypothetical protein CEXT_750851 [Caerostris extrusa]